MKRKGPLAIIKDVVRDHSGADDRSCDRVARDIIEQLDLGKYQIVPHGRLSRREARALEG